MEKNEFSDVYLAGVAFGVEYALEMSEAGIKREAIAERVKDLAESEIIEGLEDGYNLL
jgi:hypothetical protein